MRFSSVKALGIAAVLSLAVVFAASAGPAPRQVPVTADIQAYFAAHGVDQTLESMVQGDLQNYAGLFSGSDYLVLGSNLYSYSQGHGIASSFTVSPLQSN